MRRVMKGSSYRPRNTYERWHAALIELTINTGLVSRTEIESGKASGDSVKAKPALTAAMAPDLVIKGAPASRKVALTPGFKVGQHVRARNIHPAGHIPLPRCAWQAGRNRRGQQRVRSKRGHFGARRLLRVTLFK